MTKMMTELPPLTTEMPMLQHLEQFPQIIDDLYPIAFNPADGAAIPWHARVDASNYVNDYHADIHRYVHPETVKLVTSELVTNPGRHLEQAPTFISLGRFSMAHALPDGGIGIRHGFAIAVGDNLQGLCPTEPKDPDDWEIEGGRGLDIVRNETSEFGFIKYKAGKAAVALFHLPDMPSRSALRSLAA